MEENKHSEKLDAFAKKYVKELMVESPSANFTSQIMSKIEELQQPSITTVYKPLISKKMWLVILVAVIVVVLLPFNTSEESLFSLPKISFSFLEKLNFSNVLQNLHVSTTTLYLMLFFMMLMLVQIFYLKGFFERKINESI